MSSEVYSHLNKMEATFGSHWAGGPLFSIYSKLAMPHHKYQGGCDRKNQRKEHGLEKIWRSQGYFGSRAPSNPRDTEEGLGGGGHMQSLGRRQCLSSDQIQPEVWVSVQSHGYFPNAPRGKLSGELQGRLPVSSGTRAGTSVVPITRLTLQL